MLDARASLRYGKFNINDYHAQRRVLALHEVFTYSSNIGTAKIALGLGVEHHKWFLKKMGQLDRLTTELPESAMPLVPKRWGELNTITIAFGHGLSVAPLQATMAVGALMNGGAMIPPTFLKRTEEEAKKLAVQVIKPETSAMMRYLMRLNAEKGSARKADVAGFYVGGKTGTAEKVVNGRYSKTKLLTTFMAVLPADKPRYLITAAARRAEGSARDARLRHLGLERGADGRQDHRARRADARAGTAPRPAAGRSTDPGQYEAGGALASCVPHAMQRRLAMHRRCGTPVASFVEIKTPGSRVCSAPQACCAAPGTRDRRPLL